MSKQKLSDGQISAAVVQILKDKGIKAEHEFQDDIDVSLADGRTAIFGRANPTWGATIYYLDGNTLMPDGSENGYLETHLRVGCQEPERIAAAIVRALADAGLTPS